MAELKVIFDGTVRQGEGQITSRFVGGKFLLFDTPDLPLNEFYVIGMALTIFVSVIGRTVEKYVPLLSSEFIQVLDSGFAIFIPFEYTDSGYEMELTLTSSLPDFFMRIYIITSSTTLETLEEQLKEIKDKVDSIDIKENIQLAQEAGLVANQLAQDYALGILAGSLSVVTAGTSLAAEAPLLTGITVLSPLLLPGI